MTTGHRPRDHLGAGAALALAGFLLCAGCPGVSSLTAKSFATDEARDKLRAKHGLPAEVVIAAADLNRTFRLPLYRPLNRVERTFRIRQSWGLYGNGPRKVTRLEVWVDDALVYRLADPEHSWRAAQLQQRRVRPMVETLSVKSEATNWRGLGRFIVDAARADFPDAQKIAIVGTRADYGDPDASPTHGRIASAESGWELLKKGPSLLPDSTP